MAIERYAVMAADKSSPSSKISIYDMHFVRERAQD
jgi:hypothetical protein